MNNPLHTIAILDARNRYAANPDDPAIQREINWVVTSIITECFGEIVS